jgi:hypothetical protein
MVKLQDDYYSRMDELGMKLLAVNEAHIRRHPQQMAEYLTNLEVSVMLLETHTQTTQPRQLLEYVHGAFVTDLSAAAHSLYEQLISDMTTKKIAPPVCRLTEQSKFGKRVTKARQVYRTCGDLSKGATNEQDNHTTRGGSNV